MQAGRAPRAGPGAGRSGRHGPGTGFAALGVAVDGVAVLIFDLVRGSPVGIIAGVVPFCVFLALWALGPILLRRRAISPGEDDAEEEDGGCERASHLPESRSILAL